MTPETACNEELFLKLTNLVKNGQNSEFKSIVQNGISLYSVDSSGTTLLHLAARYDNVELIKFLLDSGQNIDSKTHSGTTPLLMSAVYRSYDAVKFLLNSNADLLVVDNNNISTLRVLLNPRRNVPEDVLLHVGNRLQRLEDRPEKMASIFREAGSRLEPILLLNDPELVTYVLQYTTAARRLNNDVLVELAMEVSNVDILGVVVEYGYESLLRKQILMQKIATIMMSPEANLEPVKPIVEKLIDWGVINHAAIKPLRLIFQEGSQEAVQMIINCVIDLYVREMYNRDFFKYMFRNENIDVIELLKNRFDVNEQDVNENSLLHLAVMYKPTSFVQRLLDLGADLNITNDVGRTALFYANKPDCMELLLYSGADVQVIDVNGMTIFKKVKDNAILLDMVIAYLVDQKTMKEKIFREISRDEVLIKKYTRSLFLLIWMKQHKIYKENTLYNLLKASDQELMSYFIQSWATVNVILLLLQALQFNSYYFSKLEQKLTRAFEFHDMRFNIATAVAELIGVRDPKHLVIDKIVGYLNSRDILACVKFSK